MHICIQLPTLPLSCSYTSSLAPCSIIIAVWYNYMILVPKPDTSGVGWTLCAYRYVHPCMLVYKEQFLPVRQSCSTIVNSLHHRAWNFKQCKIYVWKTVCSVTKYIYILYIYI